MHEWISKHNIILKMRHNLLWLIENVCARICAWGTIPSQSMQIYNTAKKIRCLVNIQKFTHASETTHTKARAHARTDLHTNAHCNIPLTQRFMAIDWCHLNNIHISIRALKNLSSRFCPGNTIDNGYAGDERQWATTTTVIKVGRRCHREYGTDDDYRRDESNWEFVDPRDVISNS